MATPYSSNPFQPDAAFGAAAERFYELLRTFGSAPAAGGRTDWSRLTAPLAGQFEQWLRMSQSGSPWFGASASAGAGRPHDASPAWLFGALPLGPAAAPEGQRAFELLGKLGQLQTELAVHWREIAQNAAHGFVKRLGQAGALRGGPDDALRMYELWVESAEEAYAATVRREDFSRLQSEIANATAALLVEQRRHAESLVRAFGLPTRSEIDALYAQLKELRAQVAAVDAGPGRPHGAQAQPRTPTQRKKRAPRKVRTRGKRPGRRGSRG
jgi:hypothetical protein